MRKALERHSSNDDALSGILSKLGPFPSVVRYFDDFEYVRRSVRDLNSLDSVEMIYDGERTTLDFGPKSALQGILKHVWIDWVKRFDPSTIPLQWNALERAVKDTHPDLLLKLILLETTDIDSFWQFEIFPNVDPVSASGIRAFMHSLRRLLVRRWADVNTSRIRSLVGPPRDKFARIRDGACFLSSWEQAHLLDYLEILAERIHENPRSVPDNRLVDACLLVICHDHGLRPGQVARIETSGFSFFENGSIHFRFPRSKQQVGERRDEVARKLSERWAPIFKEAHRRRIIRRNTTYTRVLDRLFFTLTPRELSVRVRAASEFVGIGSRSCYDFRHTAAQRLADAGASEQEIADFLTQSSTKIAGVYVNASPLQAQIINRALALSPLYRQVEKIWRMKTIDLETLLGLAPDHHIGGAPHGIALAGIGACRIGQSLCSRNPVLACYTCSRFLPLSDLSVHRNVLEQFRSIVNSFVDRSKGQRKSPAYLQLQQVLEAVKRLVDELNPRDLPDPSGNPSSN